MDKPTNADRIYEAEAGEAQLSFRAVLTGCILGAVVAAMNISLGLKIEVPACTGVRCEA